jgi:ankyrin repeat protein
LAKTLLEHGCDPNVGEKREVPNRTTPWGFLISDFVFFNLSKQAVVAFPKLTPDERFKTPLMAAAEGSDLEMAKLLLKNGAYVPLEDRFHRNAIDLAATPDIARYIEENTRLQFCAQKLFGALDSHGFTRSPAADALISSIAKATPEAFSVRNAQGLTGLNLTIWGNSGLVEPSMAYPIETDAVAFIHKCGIRLTGLDAFGMTPLHSAVLSANPKSVADLIKIGFEPSLPDARGITALDLAQRILDDTVRAQIIALLNGDISPHLPH